jgi:hypothetical protein
MPFALFIVFCYCELTAAFILAASAFAMYSLSVEVPDTAQPACLSNTCHFLSVSL